MKTMIVKMIVVTIAAATLANCQERTARFTVRVQDDEGKPVSGCEVVGSFFDYWKSGEGFGEDIFKKTRVLTGADGHAVIKGLTSRKDIYYSATAPDGFYRTGRTQLKITGDSDSKWQPYDQNVTIILKRKLKPIPMYAKDYRAGSSEKLWPPTVGKDYAYDLESGNWVAPAGVGKSTDIVFHLNYREFPNGDYDQILRITFPEKGDGLIAFDRDRQSQSSLASDHNAPESGYQSVIELHRTSINKVITDDARKDRNYYFRVRTKLDAQGKVVSANYGKIYGDFMSFIYYFNPTANDRNVEFDPKRNLFPQTGSTPSPCEP